MEKRILGLPLFRWLLPAACILLAVFFYTAIPGFSFSGLICLGITGILLCYNAFSLLVFRFPKTVNILRRIFTIVLCIGICIVLITSCIVVHAAQGGDLRLGCKYVLVLGCKVNPNGPSLSLSERIDATYQYLINNPNAICIASGGQGSDEPMTEAQCIYDHLTAKGIDPNRIWLEEQSTSTWENLNFSMSLIEEKTGSRPTAIGLVSSEYHLFRAGLLAKECGIIIQGIPARTSWLALRLNNYLREVAGVWHYLILGGQYND